MQARCSWKSYHARFLSWCCWTSGSASISVYHTYVISFQGLFVLDISCYGLFTLWKWYLLVLVIFLLFHLLFNLFKLLISFVCMSCQGVAKSLDKNCVRRMEMEPFKAGFCLLSLIILSLFIFGIFIIVIFNYCSPWLSKFNKFELQHQIFTYHGLLFIAIAVYLSSRSYKKC